MPPEACVWWHGTIVLLVLVHVYATGVAVALENLSK